MTLKEGQTVYVKAMFWRSVPDNPSFVEITLPPYLEYRFADGCKPVAIVRRSTLVDIQDEAGRERGEKGT